MSEKPILFSGPMVRAILEGRKTQTRRIVKLDRNCKWHGPAHLDRAWIDRGFGDGAYLQVPCDGTDHYGDQTVQRLSCPYGIVGDRFWVKEAHYRYGEWIKDGHTKTGKQKWRFRPLVSNEREKPIKIFYADNPPAQVKPNSYRKPGWYRRSSLFMPKWASRITLEITEVRPEALLDINEQDAVAEGIKYEPGKNPVYYFRTLWNSINAKRDSGIYAWRNNPWVWVITFRVL